MRQLLTMAAPAAAAGERRWRAVALVCGVLALLAVPLRSDAAPPGNAEKRAVLIGVNRYQGATRPTSGSVGDVEDLRQALLRRGWRDDHIRVLTDGGAKAGDIRDAVRWLVDSSSDASYSIFHFSGHVKQQSGHEFLWPQDNRFIADTELADQLRPLRGWGWIDIAGCESGGFNEALSGPKRLFTASSRADEKSYEMPPEYGNSVYGYNLFDQGMLQGLADRDRNGRVSINEAFQFAAERAPTMTSGQPRGPQHPQIAGGDGTEWFLDAPPPPAPPPPPPPSSPRCFIFCRTR